MASGRALVCETSSTPLRVVLINLEDTRNTMDKRIAAVMHQYGLTPADIGDRLIVIAKGKIKIKVARQLRSGDVERNEPVSSCNIQSDQTGNVPTGARATGVNGAIVVPIRNSQGQACGALGIGVHHLYEYTAEETAQLLVEAAQLGQADH